MSAKITTSRPPNSRARIAPVGSRNVASEPFVHATAVVEEGVTLEPGVQVWHFCHVRAGAVLRRGVVLGKGVFVDAEVTIGEYRRIQNGVSIYRGVSVAPWVFVGPHVVMTNDRFPRAGNRNWRPSPTRLSVGASVGAGAVLRCGIEIRPFALVGAGSVVTHDIAAFHLAVGVPARVVRMVCACCQTRLPFRTERALLLRTCCRENLYPDLYRRAEVFLQEGNAPSQRSRPRGSPLNLPDEQLTSSLRVPYGLDDRF